MQTAKVNHYAAWNVDNKNHWTAKFQGIAESFDEFYKMCKQKGFDIESTDQIECLQKDVRKPNGSPKEKFVMEDL